jgi:uncharacterized integral membrane protein
MARRKACLGVSGSTADPAGSEGLRDRQSIAWSRASLPPRGLRSAIGPQQKGRLTPRHWVAIVLAALVVIVALQNSQRVSFEVLFASFEAPMILMLLIFAGLGVLIGWAAPVLIRHRRVTKAARASLDAKQIDKK